MANALYPKFKAQLMRGTYDLQSLTLEIRAYLLDSGYTYNAAHEFLSDVTGSTRVARTSALESKAVNLTTGAFDSDDPTAQSVTGDNIEKLVLYVNTGVEGTSRLIMYQDTDITTVPFTPDGSDIRVVVGTGGWFIL